MSTTQTDQTSIYETTIENPELETLLERRESAKEARGKANAKFKEIDDLVKFKITELDLGDAPVRVGSYVIEQKAIAGRDVAFSTDPTTRLQIKLIDE